MNDPDPPECRKTIDRRAIPGRRVTDRVRKIEAPACETLEAAKILTAAGMAKMSGAVFTDDGEVRHAVEGVAISATVAELPVEGVSVSVGKILHYSDKPRRPIPDELPYDLAERMGAAINRAYRAGYTPTQAARDAYRVLLDSLRRD